MSNIILREFAGKKIRHREDGFMSLTDMAAIFGKKVADWNKLSGTQAFLKVLKSRHYEDLHSEPIQLPEGGSGPRSGSWGDRRVSIKFAAWLSPEFELQVCEWVEELMTTGTVSITQPTQPTQPVRQLAPQRDIIDYVHAMKIMSLQNSPLIKSLIEQRTAEELGMTLKKSDHVLPIGVAVRAQQLGYNADEIGTGAGMGAYVSNRVESLPGKTQHGSYEVKMYMPSPKLDEAIHAYLKPKLAKRS